ncbi:MAG TPA: hypothetical protein VMG60_04990 [Burkholderiaceae bacterium]|nr:hypothetical protein [Burkholderiaceae bacterium]
MNADPRALLAEFVQSLREESAALVRGDAELVAALATRKNDLLQRLAPLVNHDGTRLPRALVEEARDLNDRNALLLAPRLIATRARLDALRRAAQPTVYGADGRAQSIGSPFTRT